MGLDEDGRINEGHPTQRLTKGVKRYRKAVSGKGTRGEGAFGTWAASARIVRATRLPHGSPERRQLGLECIHRVRQGEHGGFGTIVGGAATERGGIDYTTQGSCLVFEHTERFTEGVRDQNRRSKKTRNGREDSGF